MRLFQNSGLYPDYLPRLKCMTRGLSSFAASRDAFLADRYGACHFLKPVLDGDSLAFFTNGDDEALQRKWAREHHMPQRASLRDVLLAQIEHHRAEVFYNLDPMRFGSDFVRKLPGCVKHTVAWRAAPSPGADFSAYSLLVCNFPSILRWYEDKGWRAAYFTPAHDPVMDLYAANTNRPVDVLFVGAYSRHHRHRAKVLEAVAARRGALNIVFHLDRSRLTRLAESPLGRLLPLEQHRRAHDIRAVSAAPLFGLDLYSALSGAKIVLNGAVDMAGDDRGNMRCFEALGCGALMVSDTGRYPDGFIDHTTMRTYSNVRQAVEVIEQILSRPAELQRLTQQGQALMKREYNKADQWTAFQRLLEKL